MLLACNKAYIKERTKEQVVTKHPQKIPLVAKHPKGKKLRRPPRQSICSEEGPRHSQQKSICQRRDQRIGSKVSSKESNDG